MMLFSDVLRLAKAFREEFICGVPAGSIGTDIDIAVLASWNGSLLLARITYMY